MAEGRNPDPWKGRRRRALVVGIDVYQDSHHHRLTGCANDAKRLAALLQERFDFGTVTLVDEAATRRAILELMVSLRRQTGPDDQALFFFSGHGSRILTSAATFETLVPHDSRRDGENRDLTDREIFGWISGFQDRARRPGAAPCLIVDACRAGGVVRDLQAWPRGVDADQRPGALADKTAFLSSRQHKRGAGPSGWLPLSDRYTLLASCLADELCRELEDPVTGRRHGALSLFVAEALASLEQPASWRDLYADVAPRVTALIQDQHPQLEGLRDREVFGSGDWRPKPFVEVLERVEKRLVLGGGASRGVVPGSVWKVLGAKARDDIGPLLGKALVREVDGVRARADLILEKPRGVTVGNRAFEVFRPVEARLRVLVAAEEAAAGELRRAAKASPILHLLPNDPPTGRPRATPDGLDAEVVVHLLPARREVGPTDPAPGLRSLAEPHWIVLDAAGCQRTPCRAATSGSVDGLVRDLDRLARHRALHGLRHPSPQQSLAPRVVVEGFKKRQGRDWEKVDDQERRYEPGDQLGLKLRHQHAGQLFVTVLDLGLSGAVSVLYPVRGHYEAWAKDQDLEIGLRADDVLRLNLPKNYPFPGEPAFRGQWETLVILLTTRHTDFDPYAQAAVGAERLVEAHPLPFVMGMALGLPRERDSAPPNALADLETWGVLHWSFWLAPP